MSNNQTYNISNWDSDPTGAERKKHLGILSVRFSTGEAYITIQDSNGEVKEELLKGEAYRRFIDFLQKHKIITSIPDSIDDVDNMTHIYLSTDTDIPDNMETVSVHDILLEREFDNLEEGKGLATEVKVTKKRLSRKTLAKDVEIHDLRVNESGVANGVTDAESLMNYILSAPLDLDPVFSLNSNLRLLTDNNDKSTDVIRLELNTMDNPATETRAEKFVDRLITGKGALDLINKINTDIAALRTFSKVSVSSVDSSGASTYHEVNADSNSDSLVLSAAEATKLVIGLDADGKIYVRHAKIDDASVSITYEIGKIMGIKSIKTDGYGHISEITTKDYNSEINEIYYNKLEMDSSYVNKSTTGTEVMVGSLDVQQSMTVRGSMKILGNLLSSGSSSKEDVTEMTIKDVLMDVGTGNDSSNRYIGFRLVKANASGVGVAAKDAFIVFDKTDNRFKFIHARVSASDQNTIYDIEAADVEAGTMYGTATTANRLNTALKLLFTGDATGSVEFYGDEGTKEVELTVNKATSTTFGTVKLLETLPDTAPTEEATVFSAAYTYELFKEFSTFNTYNGYDSTSTTLVATANAVNQVYSLLKAFRDKYDAKTAAQEAAALLARTVVTSINGSYSTIVTLDAATKTPVVSGKGYDAHGYIPATTAATSYPEVWTASYALAVAPLASRTMFTVMPLTSNLAYISLPKLDKEAMIGFVFGGNFLFKIYEYDSDTATSGVVFANSSGHNMANEYKEVTYANASSEAGTVSVAKFKNVMSMSELSNYLGTNVDSFGDTSKGYVSDIFPNDMYTSVLSSGTYNSIISDSSGPFAGAVEPVVKINGMSYSTFTGDNIKLNAALATANADSKYSYTTISSSAKSLSPTKAYMLVFYFKISKVYSNVSANRPGAINATLKNTFYTGSSFTYTTSQIIPWTETALSKMNGLTLNKWYMGVSFVGSTTFTDATTMRGIYDMTTKTKVASFNHDIPFNNYTDTTIASVVDLSFQGMDVKVASTVFTEYDSANTALSNFLSGNKSTAFYTTFNTTSYEYNYNMIQTDSNKFYKITCEAEVDNMKPSTTPLSSYTSFGTATTSLDTMMVENSAENDGFTYPVDSSKDVSVSMLLTQTAEALDATVTPDTWLTAVDSYTQISQRYLSPLLNDVITVTSDVNYAGVSSLYKFDGTMWVFLRVNTAYTWMTAVSNEAQMNQYYSVPADGSYLKVTNDEDHGTVATIYYRRGNAWEYLLSTSVITARGSYASLESIQSISAPNTYDMAYTLDTNIMYIYDGTNWMDHGTYYGWTLLGTASSKLAFTTTYVIPAINYAVKVGTLWYTYDGSKWNSMGTYISYNITNIEVPLIQETTAATISNRIATYYTVPQNNNMVKVNTDTNHESVPTYYVYDSGTRTWNYVNVYSMYVEKIQNKNLSGTISVSNGVINHKMVVKYKYITAT